jgi:peptidoglycan/xylan/chitin deacetylase (PgdA/CDA1 family)
MTQGELAEAVQAGCALAAHTTDHLSLPGLGSAALREQLDGGRARLEDIGGQPVDLIAYPFGHHDARVREAAEVAGYRAGFSFLNGRIQDGQDRFMLPRFTMHAGHSRARLAFHLARPASSWPDHQRDVVPVGEPKEFPPAQPA